MADYTLLSTTVVTVVAIAGAALAIVFFLAARRIEDRRLYYVALGFGMLFVRGTFSVYSIQADGIHHEVSELLGAVFDMAMVTFFAAPFWLRER